ncbi:MAG: iron-containing alcohol dehydrogenase [Dethiobacteria bacterium]
MPLKGSLFMGPERMVFGRGVAGDTGIYVKQLGGKKVFLVTDEIIAKLESFSVIENSLKEHGIEYYLYTDSDVNPTDVQIDQGCRIYKEEKCDVIIGVGGGSSLDTAKSIGIIATNPGSIRDNFVPNYVTNPYDTPNKNAIPPSIMIPTTSGTGSDVGCWTVVTNTAENYKGFCGGWMCMPKVALLDAEMTVSMPPRLTASTGYDALIHALEAYYHLYKTPLTDMYALSAIKRIAKYLGKAVANGKDMEAREQMLLGATEAGLAMNTGCALIHSSGLQLTSKFGLSHGETLAIMAGPVIRFNIIACAERMIDVAVAMGEVVDGLSVFEAADKAAVAMQRFALSVGLPVSLNKELHNQAKIPEMAKIAFQNDNTYGNPRIPTREELEKLYLEAYQD